LVTRNSAHPTEWFSRYHHQLHSLAFAMVVATVCFVFAKRRWITGALALLSFHLHLLEDVLGSRGPDGYQWPIPYLAPFSTAGQILWSGQWGLNAWPNFLITIGLLGLIFFWRGKGDFHLWKWFRDARTGDLWRRYERGLANRKPRGRNGVAMTIKDFRRIALSFEGAEEGSHMGSADFRVGGRIFATLAAVKLGYGNLMLQPEQQAMFVAELPEIFIPVSGGWGKNGATHVRLAAVSEDVLEGALRTAYKLRLELNAKTRKPKAIAKKANAKRTPKKKR